MSDDLPTQSLETPASRSPNEPALDSAIGHYRILSVLGEGGFGVVYLAEQSEPVRRRLALKVIKPGMDSKSVLARFQAEQQALALMNHPCVAKVLDAGVTDRSLPYFVMELVEGEPITDFCDRQRLTIQDRIQLFIKVCEAVQHAHTKGVIHRDLKPSNILVTYDTDGQPQPKVIDFGVAKALHQPLTGASLYTEQGQLIGTPEYMSPEQADMSPTGIDTRSDIYALGVLLYELLTGLRPFDLKQAALAEIQRIIRDVDPPKPSTRLSTLLSSGSDTETLRALAAARRADVNALPKRLRADLDWIVVKCLEKQRDRRYDTANAVAMELQRYLNDEPVLAGPPSASYRIGKFVKRNKVGVAASLIVALSIITGAGAAVVGFLRAEHQADLARREAVIAEQVRDFITGMLQRADPRNAEGTEVTIRAAIDAAAQSLDTDDNLFDDPIVEAEIRRTIGNTYSNLGLHDQGLEQLRHAVTLVGGFDPPPSIDAATMLQDYAHIAWMLNRLDEAERINRRVLEIRRALVPVDHLRISSAMNNLATTLADLGKSEEAAEILRKAISIEEQHTDAPARQTLRTRNNLASVLNDLGEYEAAAEIHREVFADRRRIFGPDHPSVGTSLNNLGFSLMRMGDPEGAAQSFRESIELKRRVYEPTHIDIAISLMNLASVLLSQHKPEEALLHAEEATSIFLETTGPYSWTYASSLSIKASAIGALERFTEAEQLMQEAYRVSAAAVGADHLRTRRIVDRAITLYTAWHQADPSAGHDQSAEEWRARLDAPRSPEE